MNFIIFSQILLTQGDQSSLLRFLNLLIGELENGPKDNFIRKKEQGRQTENLSSCLEEDGGEKEEAMLFNPESDT